jgi:hypothetical protein
VLLTTFGLNLGIGLVGGLVLYIFGGLLLRYFISVPDALGPEISQSLPWIACLLPLTLISAAGAGALESRELFLLVNLIQIVTMTVAQVAPVIAAVFVSPSLMVVIPTTAAVAQALGAIANLVVVYCLEGPFSFAPSIGARRGNCSAMAAGCSLRILPRARLRRSVYHRVDHGGHRSYALCRADEPCQRSGAIPVAFGRAFFPRMSSLSGAAAFALGARALSSMAYGFAAICAPAMILSPTFFRYWLGADFAVVAAPVAQVLFPGMWMFSLSFVGFTLLQSQGRADVTGKLNIIEFLPFVAVLWVLTHSLGSLEQPLPGACGA